MTTPKEIEFFDKEDKETFGTFITEMSRPLFAFAKRKGVRYNLIEDYLQETYTRLWAKVCNTKDPLKKKTAKNYMFSILENFIIEEYLKKERRSRHPIKYLSSFEGEFLEGNEPSPLETVVRYEERDAVHEAAQKLSPPFQEIFILKEFEGRAYKTIAKRLDIPVGTVKSRLSRARQSMYRLLNKLKQTA